jgi:hypothetical protein
LRAIAGPLTSAEGRRPADGIGGDPDGRLVAIKVHDGLIWHQQLFQTQEILMLSCENSESRSTSSFRFPRSREESGEKED